MNVSTLPKIDSSAIENNRTGKESSRSNVREISESPNPRRYPAITPSGTPKINDSAVASVPIISEVRAP